jgi:nuclear pore complex protein Nup155
VEWCLIITTPDEVILCALNRTTSTDGSTYNQGLAHGDGSLQLVTTSFTLPTDQVRMLSVTGTEQGRIFLGGEDGCLYEMTYDGGVGPNPTTVSVEERLDQFYDNGKTIPAVITADSDNHVAEEFLTLGKRAWVSLTSGAGPDAAGPRKCRKLNRTSNISSLASALVPDFLLSATSFLFGGKTSTGGGMIVRMIVDEERNCLYTLSSKGWICSFDLTGSSKEKVKLTAVMNAPKTARLYLEAVSRGQMLPPSTGHSSTLGGISFPGGGASAQAGVGGMEGARAILKLADLRSRKSAPNAKSEGEDILRPATIHIVPRTESSRLTLVAVTAGGLRIYLSSLAPQVLTSGPSGARGSRNPLAPSSRLTLCHIRAPPPLDMERLQDLSSVDAGVVGGLPPRVAGTVDKMVRVDASFYDKGILVTAVERTGTGNQGQLVTQGTPFGDIIVAACPDAVARKKLTAEDSKDKAREIVSVPGGITETMSMPMAAAYGAPSDDPTPILPGGIVWDIALMSDEESVPLKLATSSQTPTDTELGIGLPPAYFPPSKVRSQDSGVSDGKMRSPAGDSRDAIVPRNATLSSTALTIFGNVLSNVLLSRPIRQGITFQRPMGTELSRGTPLQPSYRVSRRDGSRGFSATAGETSSRYGDRTRTSSASPAKTSQTVHSARLRPWLLRPSVVPLNQFSTQHLLPGREVVALNAGGLHYFGFNTVLSSLADALMSAGDNVAHDPTTTRFFTSYGYKEGCAMCLALAIGCGPAAGNAGYSEQVRNRASAAALARAFIPKLVAHTELHGNGNAPMHGNSISSDPLVPPGYDFKPSALSEGLTSLFARLVRPVWNKPAVVATEGRTVKLNWSAGTRMSPAKVEILLDEASLEDIRGPLRRMFVLMRDVFDRAIKNVPGISQSEDNGMMDIEDEGGQGHYLTRHLQYNSHFRAGSAGPTTHLTPSEVENIAHLIEEKNIHSLYRLLARVVQLLNLISLLRRAQNMSELREVDWGLLHGLTISQLVQTSEGQDRLESLLNSLVTSSASESVVLATPSAEADQLAGLFADQCYLFFSPGSRFAYLGLRAASEALSYPVASSRRAALTNQASVQLRNAAEHWHSAPLISGRILHTKGQETYDQIALRAMQHNSPLAKAVDALIQLGDVANAVDVCLTSASNFMGSRSKGSSAGRLGLRNTTSTYTFGWEQDLYHKRRDSEQNRNGGLSTSSSSPSSPSHLVAYGTAVTSKDAIETCYALVFHHLSVLLSSRSELADKMVSACAYASDRSFLGAFFLHLLESDHTDTLLRIDSAELEKWLRDRKDPTLLWRYYNVLGKHIQAGQVSWERAVDASLKLPLGERVDCLSRALNAFTAAVEEGQRSSLMSGSVEELAPKVKEVSETLSVARLQNRILRSVDSMKPDLPPDMTEEKYEKLSLSLVQVSELYNDYAAALSLFDHCLLILHSCRHDDVWTIQSLWKNIICEQLLPCATRKEEVYHFLQNFVADVGLGDEIKFLSETTAADSFPVFENDEWMKGLEGRIVGLGKELYGTGADYVVPIDYLLSNLEGECCLCVRSNLLSFLFSLTGVLFLFSRLETDERWTGLSRLVLDDHCQRRRSFSCCSRGVRKHVAKR